MVCPLTWVTLDARSGTSQDCGLSRSDQIPQEGHTPHAPQISAVTYVDALEYELARAVIGMEPVVSRTRCAAVVLNVAPTTCDQRGLVT